MIAFAICIRPVPLLFYVLYPILGNGCAVLKRAVYAAYAFYTFFACDSPAEFESMHERI